MLGCWPGIMMPSIGPRGGCGGWPGITTSGKGGAPGWGC